MPSANKFTRTGRRPRDREKPVAAFGEEVIGVAAGREVSAAAVKKAAAGEEETSSGILLVQAYHCGK